MPVRSDQGNGGRQGPARGGRGTGGRSGNYNLDNLDNRDNNLQGGNDNNNVRIQELEDENTSLRLQLATTYQRILEQLTAYQQAPPPLEADDNSHGGTGSEGEDDNSEDESDDADDDEGNARIREVEGQLADYQQVFGALPTPPTTNNDADESSYGGTGSEGDGHDKDCADGEDENTSLSLRQHLMAGRLWVRRELEDENTELHRQLAAYQQAFGVLPPPLVEDKQLGAWAQNQRTNYKKEKLEEDRIDVLDSVGLDWSNESKLETAMENLRMSEAVENDDVEASDGVTLSEGYAALEALNGRPRPW